MEDFYLQKTLGGAVYHGGVLVQANGKIGGSRHVFLEFLTSGKNVLVKDPMSYYIANPFKGFAKLFAGDLLQCDPETKKAYILKVYKVNADAAETATEVQIVRDGFTHRPFVGDVLMVAPDSATGTGTAVTVTAVTKSNDYWTVTLSASLGALSKGAILVEAAEAGSDKSPLVTKPNRFTATDLDFAYVPVDEDSEDNTGARYLYTPYYPTELAAMWKNKMSAMPSYVESLNKAREADKETIFIL